MFDKIILNIQQLSWHGKALSLVLAFIAPLASLIHVILGLLIFDAITSIYYQMKLVSKSGLTRRQRISARIKVIESAKLRKTLEKMFFYILMIIVFYSFDLYVLKIQPLNEISIHTFSITNMSAVLIALVEMTSIAANVSKITDNPIFDRILKIFSKKVNKQYDIDEEDNK
jgi:uncharacterized membrane protein